MKANVRWCTCHSLPLFFSPRWKSISHQTSVDSTPVLQICTVPLALFHFILRRKQQEGKIYWEERLLSSSVWMPVEIWADLWDCSGWLFSLLIKLLNVKGNNCHVPERTLMARTHAHTHLIVFAVTKDKEGNGNIMWEWEAFNQQNMSVLFLCLACSPVKHMIFLWLLGFSCLTAAEGCTDVAGGGRRAATLLFSLRWGAHFATCKVSPQKTADITSFFSHCLL